MSKIYILGIDSPQSLQPRPAIIERCGLIVASRRHAAMLGNTFVPIQPITPLNEALGQMAEALTCGNVCVLASGDPLFYGIAGKIFQHFGRDQVEVQPALSSLQHACAGFKMPWDDARVISLHGRKERHIAGLILTWHKTFFFTDPANSPDRIARDLLGYLQLIDAEDLQQRITFDIAENLGTTSEKITSTAPAGAAAMDFAPLNVLCVRFDAFREPPPFGLQTDEIAHSRGLITKDEVRAVSLHSLRLPKEGVFWDIGGGSGSISLEAAAMHPGLTVYTVEHRKEELANIKENICRFGLFNIIPVQGRAGDLLPSLPDPDRVFVGGSDGEMDQIITAAAIRMPENGRIVVNGVTEKTVLQTPKIMARHQLAVSSGTIAITRQTQDGPVSRNPITIIVGSK